MFVGTRSSSQKAVPTLPLFVFIMSEPFNEAVDTAGEQCNDDVAPLQNITKAQLQSTLSLAGGQMLSVARQLGQIDGWELARRVEAIIHWHDLVLLLVIALITRPLLVNLFRRPLAVVIGDIISQAAWLAMVVYAVDIVVVTLVLGGVLDIERWQFLSVGVAKIIYTVWAATRLCAIKQYLLNKWAPRLLFRVDSRVAELGENEERKVQKKALLVQKITLIDKAVDVAVYICTGFVLYDVLDVEMGVGATSVFAFGSLSTVLVGLASKDIATMFFNGIAMGVSNRIQEGDYVEFGDGTTGKIQKIGWMLTTIQHYDNTTEVIPNSMLGMQRVINLSRTT